jgi:hypothetical protein
MNCEKCGSDRLRVIETRPCQGNVLRRRRTCRKCGWDFSTTERISVYEEGNWQDRPSLEVVTVEAKAKAPAKPRPTPTKFWPITADQVNTDLFQLPEDMRAGLLLWWNTSRRSKHGTKATWTAGAWQLSVKRVVDLWLQGQQDLARKLVQEGAEVGWQALKLSYIQGLGRPVVTIPAKPDPFMQSAGEPWDTAA